MPGEAELTFSRNDSGDLNMRPGKDGTIHIKTEDGDFIVTNGVNNFVTTDDQGRTKEITIVTDENGRGIRRVNTRAFSGGQGGPARVRSAGGGLGGGIDGDGGRGFGIGGEAQVEEDVVAPPTPAKP